MQDKIGRVFLLGLLGSGLFFYCVEMAVTDVLGRS